MTSATVSTESAAALSVRDEVAQAAKRARVAAAALAPTPRAAKDAALHAAAAALLAASGEVLAANAEDVTEAEAGGTPSWLVDRLMLNADRINGMAQGLRNVAALPDPVGEVVRGSTLPNGLKMRQLRTPLGVVAIVYEARPNVTADAAALTLKSGNAVLLRGSSSARRSNAVLTRVLSEAIAKSGLPGDAVQLISAESRDSVTALLQARGVVDVIIPRGGAGLISHVVENSRVPVIETGVGNCHVYVDSSAKLDMAVEVAVNAKISRPSVCNSAEKLLVHVDIAEQFLPRVAERLAAAGVTLHTDDAATALLRRLASPATLIPATDADWEAEYLSLDMGVAVVDSVDAAIAHIRRWTSGHTEAILADSQQTIAYFVARMDSAAVMVNASTRFTDGGEFGFGAEIGVSTQKLHARGPMGLTELTGTTFVVTGDGHVR
ncbi:MAG: glutamate-5-semialdehyde dehydrogenase [Mycobacteriales bacterium]